MAVLPTLREANVVRQAEWDTGGNVDLAYAGNELAGEVGEALELATMSASPSWATNLAKELGDVVICCDLIAMRLDLSLDTVVEFDGPSERTLNHHFLRMGAAAGRASNIIKKLERERHGMVGSRATAEELRAELNAVIVEAYVVAHLAAIDLAAEVAKKFNETSAKYGLHTRLEYA